MKVPMIRNLSLATGILLLVLGLTARGFLLKEREHGLSRGPSNSLTVKQPDLSSHLTTSLSRLPLGFELNRGQADNSVKFLAHASSYDVYMESNEVTVSLRSVPTRNSAQLLTGNDHHEKLLLGNRLLTRRGGQRQLRMRLVGANQTPQTEGLEELPGTVDYFIGRDPRKWHTDIRTYSKVIYRDVYPGIDQVFHGNERKLEYDFIISPGADPSRIRLAFAGIQHLGIDHGDLVLGVRGSDKIRLKKPFAYQDVNDTKHEVAARYVIRPNHQVGLEVGAYDVTKLLIIDPVIAYSTYVGGSGNDAGFDIAVDGSGNTYVTGSTDSPEFSSVSGNNAFVAKLNATGTQRTYLAIIGGAGDDTGFGIAIDSSGDAFITGTTSSVDFPVVNPIQSNFGGGSQDAFIAKLHPSGSALIYSTYLGGSGSDQGFGLSLDMTGSAYVTGSTDSGEFSTRGGSDVFVTKINPTGTQREYFATLGGGGDDTGFDIAVASDGSACIVGTTNSVDFTTANALQSNLRGSQDAFIAKLNPVGSPLIYSTYFGGSGTDSGFGIMVDGAGNAYVTGSTDSPEFTNLGGQDVFVAKFSSSGNERTYLATFGGSANDAGLGIAVDSGGNAYVTGSTDSSNFTTANALQPNPGGSQDGFVAKLDTIGSALQYSTFLGGSGKDFGSAIAVDNNGNSYVSGFTSSSDFPTSSPLQSIIGGKGDAFLTKITDSGSQPSPTPSPSPTTTPTPTPTASPVQLILDQSGPASDQAVALDSVLFLRDPFPVINTANVFNQGPDRNSRVIIFVTNLELAQGESSASVVVNLVDGNSQSYDIVAEDVRPVPNLNFAQVIFRLPNGLSVGTCTIKVKVHGQVSNQGTMRIRV